MERLPGLLGAEPVYWVDAVTDAGGGRLRVELGFSDVAAHPYERLVAGTIGLLRTVPGVEQVTQEHREVVAVVCRGVTVEQVAEVVDRYWFENLPRTPVDPGFELDPADVLASPWPSAPPPPRGVPPVATSDRSALGVVRDAAATLPPSRGRMWTYLVCGAVPLGGGVLLALDPGGSTGVVPMALGAVNLAVGGRIALRRRGAGASGG